MLVRMANRRYPMIPATFIVMIYVVVKVGHERDIGAVSESKDFPEYARKHPVKIITRAVGDANVPSFDMVCPFSAPQEGNMFYAIISWPLYLLLWYSRPLLIVRANARSNYINWSQTTHVQHIKGSRQRCCSWWRHQMEIFSALLAICAGNSTVTGEFPAQRPVTRSLDDFFICAWINTREAGDLGRHRAHYDAPVMWMWFHLTLVHWRG